MIGKSAHILLIDGEEAKCDILDYLLEGEGYEVRQAHSGTQALSDVKQERFDLIVADIAMPDMDGLEMFRHLVEIDQDATVIVMTDQPSLNEVMKAVEEGAFDYLSRPLDDPDEMLATVVNGLAEHQEVLQHRSVEGGKTKCPETERID